MVEREREVPWIYKHLDDYFTQILGPFSCYLHEDTRAEFLACMHCRLDECRIIAEGAINASQMMLTAHRHLEKRADMKVNAALNSESQWRNGIDEAVERLAKQYGEHFDARDLNAFRYIVELARRQSP